MDITTLALARRYANDKIAKLGTIQTLKGRVPTYNDLLQIQNPAVGDVYIVGVADEENNEYIYVGDEWEKLGPIIDTNNLATISYVDRQVAVVNNKIVPPTSVSLTGEGLSSALNNNQLNVGDSVTCTESYSLNNTTYLKGHTYAIKEKERGEVSITDQLIALGFTVSIASRLESYGIKYFYIVEYGDEGSMYAAYSKVPLNVSNSKFPASGWKTFSVRKMNSSDPNFYYAEWNTNKRLTTMTELTSSTNDGLWWASQFSSATKATYSNDPGAAAYTKYIVNPNEMVRYVEDITATTTPDGEDLITEDQVGEMLTNYYTVNEVDHLIYSAVGTVEQELDEIIEGA